MKNNLYYREQNGDLGSTGGQERWSRVEIRDDSGGRAGSVEVPFLRQELRGKLGQRMATVWNCPVNYQDWAGGKSLLRHVDSGSLKPQVWCRVASVT